MTGMSAPQSTWNRLAVIASLAKRVPAEKLGRTAVMKHLYFLQVLRELPLDYNFKLYTYGAFDRDVLDDLHYAESLGAINSEITVYQMGYGYRVTCGANADDIINRASEFLQTYKNDIEWVTNEFGNCFASELELISTIIYVDRELAQRAGNESVEDIVNKVSEVKPRFGETYIKEKVQSFISNNLLKSLINN